MKCRRCDGRQFLDRTYTDNSSFEIACLHCGAREFISKGSELGQWLDRRETQMLRVLSGLRVDDE